MIPFRSRRRRPSSFLAAQYYPLCMTLLPSSWSCMSPSRFIMRIAYLLVLYIAWRWSGRYINIVNTCVLASVTIYSNIENGRNMTRRHGDCCSPRRATLIKAEVIGASGFRLYSRSALALHHHFSPEYFALSVFSLVAIFMYTRGICARLS